MVDYKLLEELTQAWGVSGREKRVREIIRREIAPYASDILIDAVGNMIVYKPGTAPDGARKKIMLSAHMDEIGAQVTKIEPDGRIRLRKVGWVWTGSMYNDKVIFQNGTVGVVGCMGPVEEAHNETGKLYVDIGCTTREQTQQYVNIGDFCGFIGNFYRLANGRICSKSLDDRIGCYLLIEALKAAKDCPNDVYYVFSVQEETGCRGATVAAERIRPDIGISIDVTPDHAYPCDLEGSNEVGEGVAVGMGDPSCALDEYLVSEMLSCCEENGIKYQRDVIDRGGTDASTINMAYQGVRVAALAVVTRYPHAQSSVIAESDVDAAQKLLECYCARTFTFED